jgi:hypothetical protein
LRKQRTQKAGKRKGRAGSLQKHPFSPARTKGRIHYPPFQTAHATKSAMLILAIFAGREKISKIVSRIRPRSFGLVGCPTLDPRVATLPGEGIYPDADKVLEPHPNCFAFRRYKPCCCMRPCCRRIIRVVIAGGQSPFSSCDTSLQCLVTAKLCKPAALPKWHLGLNKDFFWVSAPFFRPKKSQKSRFARTRAFLIEAPIAGVILNWHFSGGGQHDGV